jgi:hypothetical protein
MVIEKYSNLTRVAIGLLLSITGGGSFRFSFFPL